MDAAGHPRALRDDDGEPDDEDPAREHRAPGTADRVQNGDEGPDGGNGGGPPRQRARLDQTAIASRSTTTAKKGHDTIQSV